MEWLTAILAFATTMLIFSVITTTLVETFHRLLGSRSFGLIKMLEHMYDRVIEAHMNDARQPVPDELERSKRRNDFVKLMIMVRAPALVAVKDDDKATSALDWWSPRKLIGHLRWLLGYIIFPGFS